MNFEISKFEKQRDFIDFMGKLYVGCELERECRGSPSERRGETEAVTGRRCRRRPFRWNDGQWWSEVSDPGTRINPLSLFSHLPSLFSHLPSSSLTYPLSSLAYHLSSLTYPPSSLFPSSVLSSPVEGKTPQVLGQAETTHQGREDHRSQVTKATKQKHFSQSL